MTPPYRMMVGNSWTDAEFQGVNVHSGSLANLLNALMVDVPGAKFTWDFKSGAWDGKASLFIVETETTQQGLDWAYIKFPTGLFPLVFDAAKRWYRRSGILVDNRWIPQVTLNPCTVPLRDYQFGAVSAALQTNNELGWWPRAVLHVATGGGKTEMAVAIYQMHMVPTMFLVHRKDLLYQAKERFEKYGIQVGIIGDGKFDPFQPGVTISTMQSIISAVKIGGDPTKHHLLQQLIMDTRQVFFDEAHLLASTIDKGNTFVTIASSFKNAYARWGLTGTPFMRSAYDNMLLMGATGELACSITNEQLIEAGHLSQPTVIMRRVPGTLKLKFEGSYKSTKAGAKYWRDVEDKGIKFNDPRNEIICQEVQKGPHPCLVLVKTIDQANHIQLTMRRLFNSQLTLITGDATAFERRNVVSRLRDGSLSMVMATTIFDEGIDIPELLKVILASGGKSQVKLLQRIGRGLRKADGKSTVEIIDFSDTHHAMLKRHADERRAVWREQGFTILEQ